MTATPELDAALDEYLSAAGVAENPCRVIVEREDHRVVGDPDPLSSFRAAAQEAYRHMADRLNDTLYGVIEVSGAGYARREIEWTRLGEP